ncbi:CENPP protein, partial [Bombycilla garrulus]|nr:CENPP protein [Bombycilla garrulus]
MDKSIFQPYEDEIQALEEEIRQLTEEYEDMQDETTFFSEEEILKSIKSFERETQGETNGHESLSDLKAQLESLVRDLSFLMEFTGIHFTSHSKKTVEKTGNRTVQKHRLSGRCHSLPFQLEFKLLEMQNDEKETAVVSDLSIVMESREDSNVMSKFLSSIEERADLLTFFRSLSTYAEWHEHRRATFLHFKAKYPDIVSLPEGLLGDFIILRSPKVSGLELMIVWKIHFDEEGTTTPVLDLLPKVPEQVLEQRMTSVESIPGSFRSALRLFGIEAAIENLVKVLGSEK